jgi:peroxiredoxin
MSTEGTVVTVGSPAPPFTLPTSSGQPRTLAEYLARGPVLLAFHRGIW